MTTFSRDLAFATVRPLLLFVFCLAVGVLSSAAQTVDDVYPLAPEDGARVGPRPILSVGVEGSDLLKMRFRIVMSRDDFETEAYVFDQQEEKNGWAYTGLGLDEEGALYRTGTTLEHGTYDWKTYAWDGVNWVEGDTVFRLHVDNAIPADVEGLRLRLHRDGIRLDWDPVAFDEHGEAEYVLRYHVYRFARARHHFMRAFEVGLTEDTFFIDRSADGNTLFYKVKAEDEAGNHQRHRWKTVPPPTDEPWSDVPAPEERNGR